jgi:hypothetical protein
MHKIKTVSTYALKAVNFLLVFWPIFTIFAAIFCEVAIVKQSLTQGIPFQPLNYPGEIVRLTIFSKFLQVISGLVAILPFYLGLLSLKVIFTSYTSGEIFNHLNVKHYSRLGWLLLLDALMIKPLNCLLASMVYVLSNEPGHRYLTISFGAPNINSIFYGTLIIIISWVMRESLKIYDEHKYIV